MKKKGITVLVVLTMLLTGLVGLAEAGHRGRHGKLGLEMFMFKMDMLADELGMTEDQRASIKAIIEEKRPVFKPLVEEMITGKRALQELVMADPVDENAIRLASTTMGEKIAELSIMASGVIREIRSVLTPEQVEKLTELHQKRMKARDKALAWWRDRNTKDAVD